jgi:uncharacterized protein
MTTRLGRTICVALALAACGAAAQVPVDSARGSSQIVLAPVADHHVHLRSLAVNALFTDGLPVIDVPADVQTLLREFETHWRGRDARAFAALFTADGVMQVEGGWRLGPGAIHIARLGAGGNIRLDPQSFGGNASYAHVAGSYGRVAEPPPGERGKFLLVLVKVANGPWRIAAATLENRAPDTSSGPSLPKSIDADDLIAQLDAAGIERAAVLSWAYQFGQLGRRVANEAAMVRAENDWTAEQVTRHPGRLVGFCSLNPLKDYALAELASCMGDARITGLKLHFTTADVDLRDAKNVERLRGVFRAANARRFPLVIHMRTLDPAYGRRDAEVFVNELLPEARDTTVHIAHLAGWGGYGPETDAAFGVFADAIAAGDPRVANLYFDIAAIVAGTSSDQKAAIVRRLRQIGMSRVLFAIDGPVTRAPWELFRTLPLTEAEFQTVATNLAPYMQRRSQ